MKNIWDVDAKPK